MRAPAWTSTTSSSNWAWQRNAANAKAAPVSWSRNAAPRSRSLASITKQPRPKAEGSGATRAADSYTIRLSALACSSVRPLNRNIVIGGSVVLFHAAALWALQSGLLRRSVEVVVPVEILTELVTPPQPKVEPAPPPPRPEPPPAVKPRVVKKVERVPPPAPQPVAVREAPPAPSAPTGITTPQPPPPAIAAPVTPSPAPPAPPPAPPRIELPVSDADYLQNP